MAQRSAPWTGAVRSLVAVLACATAAAAQPQTPGADLEIFTRPGCPRCTAAELYVEVLRHQRPGLRVVVRDVEADPMAAQRLQDLATAHGVRMVGVPAFVVRGTFVVGFGGADTAGAQIRALLDNPTGPAPPHATDALCPAGTAAPCGVEPATVTLPLLGPVSPRGLGLPAFTVAVGLLDGFNPCAMWVLLFLLSLLVNLGSRPKMLLIGGTFVAVSGLVYFAFMAAWLNVLALIGLARPVQLALGLLALVVGGINVKDFVAFKRGVSLSIPESAKPGIYARMRRILLAENLTGALAAAVVLAVLVNMVELLCTAGLPAVYTQILTLRALPWWRDYAYLALYNAAYMLDDSIMLGIAVVTLGRRKLHERGGRWLKLVSGAVMLGLGVVLLVNPNWLTAH